MNSTAKGADAPALIIFPPVVYIGTLLSGLLMQIPWPIRVAAGFWIRVAGVGTVLFAGAIARWGVSAMRQAGTNILPNQPALTIVRSGPFRYSRNPLYMANAIFYVGLALIFNAAWPLILFVPMLGVIYWGVILREERYLETKFGSAYLDYKSRVRRWL